LANLRKWETIALMIIAWMSISSASVLVLLSNANAYAAAFWRLLFSFLILLPVGLLNHGISLLRLSPASFTAGVLLGLHFLLWMQSLFMISVALSTTIVVTYPAVIAVLERVLLKEKLSAQQLAGIILGTAGVAVLVRPSLQNESFAGIALAGVASLLAAGYFMLGRIARRGEEDLLSYVLPAYLMVLKCIDY